MRTRPQVSSALVHLRKKQFNNASDRGNPFPDTRDLLFYIGLDNDLPGKHSNELFQAKLSDLHAFHLFWIANSISHHASRLFPRIFPRRLHSLLSTFCKHTMFLCPSFTAAGVFAALGQTITRSAFRKWRGRCSTSYILRRCLIDSESRTLLQSRFLRLLNLLDDSPSCHSKKF